MTPAAVDEAEVEPAASAFEQARSSQSADRSTTVTS